MRIKSGAITGPLWVLVFLLLLQPGVANALPMALQLCARGNGSITAKQRCTANETRLTTANLGQFGLVGPQGPKGDAGFTLSQCRFVGSSQSTTGGATTATITCGSNEFLLTYGHETRDSQNNYTVVALTMDEEVHYNGSNLPQSVVVGARVELETPLSYSAFTLYVNGLCCPAS